MKRTLVRGSVTGIALLSLMLPVGAALAHGGDSPRVDVRGGHQRFYSGYRQGYGPSHWTHRHFGYPSPWRGHHHGHRPPPRHHWHHVYRYGHGHGHGYRGPHRPPKHGLHGHDGRKRRGHGYGGHWNG